MLPRITDETIKTIIDLIEPRLQLDKPELPEIKKATATKLTPSLFTLHHLNTDRHVEQFLEHTLIANNIRRIIFIRDNGLARNNLDSCENLWNVLSVMQPGQFKKFGKFVMVVGKEQMTYHLHVADNPMQFDFKLHFVDAKTIRNKFADAEFLKRILRFYQNTFDTMGKTLIDSCHEDTANPLSLSFFIFELLRHFRQIHPLDIKPVMPRDASSEEAKQLIRVASDHVFANDIITIVESIRKKYPAYVNNKKEFDQAINWAFDLYEFAEAKTFIKSNSPHLSHFTTFQSCFHSTLYRFFYPAENISRTSNDDDTFEQNSFWRCCP
jgi:hypothetical protein